MQERVKHEGVSFLTLTLPSLGADFEKSLALGQIEPDCFRSFKKRLKVPAFLQGFFALVFDIGTGGLLNEPSVEAIAAIRQISYSCKKVLLPCSDSRTWHAFENYIECERELSRPIDPTLTASFIEVSDALWRPVFGGKTFAECKQVPKHGPGSTADKLSGNAKYKFSSWHDRLEPYFPVLTTAFSNEGAYGTQEFEALKIVNEEQELPVKVITVPKTLKAPRIIAMEPCCMQYTQQAVSSYVIDQLESHQLTKGHVNFADQSINRRLAKRASLDGSYATLDLSAASDRVPLSLVSYMFDGDPDLWGAIESCRSRRAQLPSGDIYTLRKFASMGSALCFPIEAMYFYTLCVMALLRERDLPVTFLNVLDVSRDVYVYGDDIIVPTGEAEAVVSCLHKYYCKVGMSKSFWTGRFRESCGMDAYAGEEVTPTYIRQLRPRDRQDSAAIIGWVKTSNLFYQKGYWLTADHLIKAVEKIIGTLPIVSSESEALGKISFQRAVSINRWGLRYHRPEVRAWVARPAYRTDELDGNPALLKCLLELEQPSSLMARSKDRKHLSRSARHGAVKLKRRWTSPY
jgi:hypothetical protein